MTQRNITGGFRITGIYPFNRSALKVNDSKQEGKQDTSQPLLEETGLAYIPMYSTEEGSRSRESPDLEMNLLVWRDRYQKVIYQGLLLHYEEGRQLSRTF